MTNAVLLEIDRGVARITLNRPDRLNAFDADMAVEWAALAAEAVARPEVRAVLLASEGRAFCAGGDVRAMAGFADREGELKVLAERINEGLISLFEAPIPVVAAAQGTTAGGGLGLMLASDYAIAGESSKIGSLYGGVGLTPDLTVTALLARAVGERRALQLALQERLLTGAEALEWGLVAEVVADDQVRDRAEAVARQWADGVPYAYGQAKRLIRSQPSRSFREQLAEEARTIAATSVLPEADERIRAFGTRGK